MTYNIWHIRRSERRGFQNAASESPIDESGSNIQRWILGFVQNDGCCQFCTFLLDNLCCRLKSRDIREYDRH
jgi:hypothetical protein